MSFLAKWFKNPKTTKSKTKVYSSSDEDNIMSDEENLTIAHSSLNYNAALKQIEQIEKKQQKQFEQLNVCAPIFHSFVRSSSKKKKLKERLILFFLSIKRVLLCHSAIKIFLYLKEKKQ